MTARCQSCGRALTRDGCRHDDFGWSPPDLDAVVTPTRGLAWITHARAQLRRRHDLEEVRP